MQIDYGPNLNQIEQTQVPGIPINARFRHAESAASFSAGQAAVWLATYPAPRRIYLDASQRAAIYLYMKFSLVPIALDAMGPVHVPLEVILATEFRVAVIDLAGEQARLFMDVRPRLVALKILLEPERCRAAADSTAKRPSGWRAVISAPGVSANRRGRRVQPAVAHLSCAFFFLPFPPQAVQVDDDASVFSGNPAAASSRWASR